MIIGALAALCLAPVAGVAQERPLCDRAFTRIWCGSCSGSPFCNPEHSNGLIASYSCATGEELSAPGCVVSQCGANGWCDGASFDNDDRATQCQPNSAPPGGPPVPERPFGQNGADDDYDGCIDNGITLGSGECTCVAECSPKPTSCLPPDKRPKATCDPYKPEAKEICFNRKDDNCNRAIDENCSLPLDKCLAGGLAGKDPILIGSRSAATEPFTDFSVDVGVVSLSITRTYSSADASYFGEPAGVFGRGWHHQWEASLSCDATSCLVASATDRPLRFMPAGSARSLDGGEQWGIYRPYVDPLGADDNQSVLVRKPGGGWSLFSPDGSERRFAVACDACGSFSGEAHCVDPLAGGLARLVEVVDARGNSIHLTYDRPRGVLFSLSDELGHSLEVRGTACGDGLASALVYDGMTVATYSYAGADLSVALDADGRVLRSYGYDTLRTERLAEVWGESGDVIAAFWYDDQSRATGVMDASSSVAVDYDAPGGVQVTEYFGDAATATSARTLDVNGAVTSISEDCACGPARTFTWVNRRLVCSADTLGHVTWRDYDALGRETHSFEYASQAGCPAGAPTQQDYAGSHEAWRTYGLVRPIAQGVTLDLDAVTASTRWSSLRVSTKIGVTYDYDPAPKSTDPAGYACQQAPLPIGSVVCREVESGFAYNDFGTPVLERHATYRSYDARGRLTREYGPVNLDAASPSEIVPLEERSYWPDDEGLSRRGRLLEVRRYPSPTSTPLVTHYDYDAFGAFVIRAPDGGETMFVKDGRGRATYTVTPGPAVTEVRYRDGQVPRLTITPTAAAVKYGYDLFGRLASEEHLASDPEVPGAAPALAWGEYHAYDGAGNRHHSERRDAAGVVTWQQEREFDVQHRVRREVNPEHPDTARTFDYDGSGFLREVTDEGGRKTRFVPDALRRVKQVVRSGTDASGSALSRVVADYGFPYYADQPSSVQDGGAQTTTYQRDDFGRVRWMQIPIGFSGPAFRYDTRGNVVQMKVGSYSTIAYAYDGLDRITELSATNTWTGFTTKYTYRYDTPTPGVLSSVIEPERTTEYAHDNGRLKSETIREDGVAAPLVTSYGYEADGALAEITYPSGLRVQLVRDPATRAVVEVKNADSGELYASAIQHLPGGPLTGLRFGNGLSLSQSFDLRYQPKVLSSGPTSLGYAMYAAGDVESITEGATTRTFQYDFLDQLSGSAGWFAYAYDGSGRRKSETVDGVTRTYTQSGGGFVRQTANATMQFSADTVGNTNSILTNDYTCLIHDALSRLVAVGPPAGWATCARLTDVAAGSAQFKYDARNRRIARRATNTSQWTYVISDDTGNPLSELALVNGAWVPVRDYVWLDGQPLAQLEYPGRSGGSGQGYAYYFHLDHIGLPRALTNATGQVVWSAVARPYGDIIESTSTDPLSGRTVVTNLRLPGQYDERLFGPLGLQGPYYNWNRWYLPGVGRYLEPDPIALEGGFNGEWGPDWYGYANANPLRWTDPWGLQVPCNPFEGTAVCACKQGNPSGCEAANMPMPKPKPRPPVPPPLPDPDCDDDDDHVDCDAQYADDVATCRGSRVPKHAKPACYESAMTRKNLCEQRRPLPPLHTG